MRRGIIALVSRCKITGGELSTTDEVTAFRWATEADITQMTEEAYAIRILDALHDERLTAVRQHDGVLPPTSAFTGDEFGPEARSYMRGMPG